LAGESSERSKESESSLGQQNFGFHLSSGAQNLWELLWQHLESGASRPLGSHHMLESLLQEIPAHCLVEPYIENEVRYQLMIERNISSRIPVGSAHGKPAPGAFWRCRSRRQFVSLVIDLDSRRIFAHDLSYLFWRRRSNSNLALVGLSPRRTGTRTF
jgi:hypothetical protein